MNNPTTTTCVRCGRQRIVLSIKEETVGTSTIITTETICPDPECQKKVDGMLSLEQEKRHQSFVQRQERMTGRKPAKVV